jgi:cytochrome P450
LFQLARDPIPTLSGWRDEFGDLAAFRVGPWRLWLLNDPEAIRYVLETNYPNYPKSINYREMEVLLGKGLLTSEGSFWLRQRKLVQPAFHARYDALYFESMVAATEALLAEWEAAGDQVSDVAPDMMRLAIGVVGRALFGIDLAREALDLGAALKILLRYVENRTSSILRPPYVLPTPANVRARRAVRVLDDITNGIIRERRARPDPGDDVLGALLRARDEGTREGMDDRQVRDEVVTLLLAGHETSANALSWTWSLLAKHPEYARKLEAEVDALGDRRPTLEDIQRLRWPLLIAQEGLRLYPPAWWIERQAAERDELLGYPVAPGTFMVVSPYTIQRHPRYWERPEEFDPERFTPERSAGRPRHVYIPFGAGPRLCVGSRFALLEIQVALVLIARRFRFELVPDHPLVPESLVTLRPKYGVRLARRRRA